MKDKFDNIKPLINIGWGDELKAYEDGDDLCIIKVKDVEQHSNYKILFDGDYYYLIDSKDNLINKNKIKEDLIPDGIAKSL